MITYPARIGRRKESIKDNFQVVQIRANKPENLIGASVVPDTAGNFRFTKQRGCRF
jgi:hypothetical protein